MQRLQRRKAWLGQLRGKGKGNNGLVFCFCFFEKRTKMEKEKPGQEINSVCPKT